MSCTFEITIVSKNIKYTDECLKYAKRMIKESKVDASVNVIYPDGQNICLIENSKSKKAEYRMFLEDNCFIVNFYILNDIAELFMANEKIGAIGVFGYSEDDKGNGRLCISKGGETVISLEESDSNLVKKILPCCWFDRNEYIWDGDVSYEDNCSCATDYYLKKGKPVIVPNQKYAWCHLDCEENNDGLILSNVLKIGQIELKKGNYVFCKDSSERELINKYEDYKFALRRAENRFEVEEVRDLLDDIKNGNLSEYALNFMIQWETSMKYRSFHTLTAGKYDMAYCEERVEKGVINIATSINRNYVSPMCVMLNSLFLSDRELEYNIYVLNSELWDEDKKLLTEFVEKYKSSISFIQIDKEKYAKIPVSEWSIETLYRLEMLERLPETVDRLLYLDVDIIVQRSLKNFYYQDFEGYDMVACPDMGSDEDMRNTMFDDVRHVKGYKYCCAGVILWNVESLRQQKIGFETYLEVAKKYNYNLYAPDQDLINYVHVGKIKLKDEYRYNCFAYNPGWTEDEVRRDTYIIHYAGPKPWNDVIGDKYVNRMVYKIWWEYILGTPFEKEYLQKIAHYYYSANVPVE